MALEQRMNLALERLGLHGWEAAWVPDPDMPRRGESKLESKIILVYDLDQKKAWKTFVHEVLEVKRRASERPWRLIVNALLGALKQIAYEEKESYLEGLPDVLAALDELEAE